jgi:hypothetical protein
LVSLGSAFLGYPPAGGAAVETVNGVAPDGGGNVEITVADIPYTPIYAGSGAPSTTLEAQVQWRENHVGTDCVIWSEPTLEAAAPAGAITPDTHTIAAGTQWTSPFFGAPISLLTDNTIELVHPGSITASAIGKVTVIADAAAAAIRGEALITGVNLVNVRADPAARDVQVQSPAGRPVGLVNVTLLGFGGALLENINGPGNFDGLVLFPPAPGAVGVQLDGNLGSILITSSFAQAPGGAPYIAFDVLDTATVLSQLVVDTCSINTVLAGDSLLRLGAGATYPTGPLPTSLVGVRVVNTVTGGPGTLFETTGLGADDIEVSSFGHLGGPRSNWIGDARLDTSGAPPDALLEHVGQPGVPLLVPYNNAQNGGVGGTFRELTPAAATSLHTLILGFVATASVNAGGTYVGGDGDYPATQASTSGLGVGAEFTVTLLAGTITAVVSVDEIGSDYEVADTITLLVVGPAQTVAAVLAVDAAEWKLRTDGPTDDLTGTVTWVTDFQRGVGGGTSVVIGYLERQAGGVGGFIEVPGSRSVPLLLLASPQRVTTSAELKGIGSGDEWRIRWINDIGGPTSTLFTIVEVIVVGQP